MIKHIVLFEVDKTYLNTPLFNSVINELGNLRNSEIPEIKSFIFGENCSPEGLAKGFNYGFIMEFNSNKDRDRYLDHPRHKQIASEKLLPLLVDGINSVLVFDF